MFTPEQIDRIILRFDTQLQTVSKNLFNRLEKIVRSNRIDDAELAGVVSELDFFAELNKSGYASAVSNLNTEYENIVSQLVREAKAKGLDKIAGVGINQLDTLINTDMQTILRSGAFISEELKSSLIKSIVSGVNRNQIISEILPQLQEQVKFNPSWLKTAINQAFATFQSTAMAAVFEDAPESKFELIHRTDKDTRPLCRHAIERMQEYPDGLTIAQINAGTLYKGYSKRYASEPDSYTFDQRGGFNCRGFWAIKEIIK